MAPHSISDTSGAARVDFNVKARRKVIPTRAEARKIAAGIKPILQKYADRYDTKKYPPRQYRGFLRTFSALNPKPKGIRDSLVWKWGHVGKSNFPKGQQRLIEKVQDLWERFAPSPASKNPQATFRWWAKNLPKTAYISVAYITHLVHHSSSIPIIDQHNFRACNYLLHTVSAHVGKQRPSSWEDIVALQRFVARVLKYLPGVNRQELDRFLMMYGKSIKARRKRRAQ